MRMGYRAPPMPYITFKHRAVGHSNPHWRWYMIQWRWNGLGAASDAITWPWPRFVVRERPFDWERDT